MNQYRADLEKHLRYNNIPSHIEIDFALHIFELVCESVVNTMEAKNPGATNTLADIRHVQLLCVMLAECNIKTKKGGDIKL